jgi:hypothetical protein
MRKIATRCEADRHHMCAARLSELASRDGGAYGADICAARVLKHNTRGIGGDLRRGFLRLTIDAGSHPPRTYVGGDFA